MVLVIKSFSIGDASNRDSIATKTPCVQHIDFLNPLSTKALATLFKLPPVSIISSNKIGRFIITSPIIFKSSFLSISSASAFNLQYQRASQAFAKLLLYWSSESEKQQQYHPSANAFKIAANVGNSIKMITDIEKTLKLICMQIYSNNSLRPAIELNPQPILPNSTRVDLSYRTHKHNRNKHNLSAVPKLFSTLYNNQQVH
jgi:hypothetical protein